MIDDFSISGVNDSCEVHNKIDLHMVQCLLFLEAGKDVVRSCYKALHLLCTNFYDDYILASKPALCTSARCSLELVFHLTGWLFADEGKKATSFSSLRKALGVQFGFSRSEQGASLRLQH